MRLTLSLTPPTRNGQELAACPSPTLAATAKAWPFEQARELKARIDKLEKAGRAKDAPVVFETGYGPSGLPHIGTFGEVVRTTMVRRAFEALTDGAVQDAPHLRLRRHGRHAQDSGHHPEPGEAAGLPAEAADLRARSVRHARELWRPHERAPAGLPRQFRLRLRIRLGDRRSTRPACSTRCCAAPPRSTTTS